MSLKVKVIGSGFAGISAAAYLAREGYSVEVYEKNEGPGGRCSVFSENGFTFDMGPSWYWMPDVFERFFGDFGHQPSDFYQLERLDPAYRVYYGDNDYSDIPASMEELEALFESHEKGSALKLRKFLEEAAYKYKVGIEDLVYRPSRSVWEFIDPRLLGALFRMQLFTSIRSHINGMFTNDRLRKLLEFPTYFLGALPENTPALYSLMNYADLSLGTWYPQGGMHNIIKGMVQVAEEQGARFHYNEAVRSIQVENGVGQGLNLDSGYTDSDIIVAGADYHHVDQHLLQAEHRNYDAKFWDKQVMAPSALIYYLGVDKPLKGLLHHNLFFDQSFEKFAQEIYTEPQWPSNPLFYACVPSKTDKTVAPEGKENLFILVPVAPGLEDGPEVRERYYDMVMERLEKMTGQEIRPHVSYRRDFAHKDFIDRYNAFKGNAYGLANTLMQTAIFKPSLKNKKVSNLYYTGQLTVPGPGVPPSIISGKVVAGEVAREFSTINA